LAPPLSVSALTGALSSLNPVALVPELTTVPNTPALCVDEPFTAPAGVHLSLFRFISLAANHNCANAEDGTSTIVGYEAVRPDRVRYIFSADGHILSMIDPNGVELRYQYAIPQIGGVPNLAAVGPLQAIYEPRQIS